MAVWRRGRILAFHLAAPASILGIPKNFSLCVADTYWQRCLESGQRLDDVNQTHLVLASATKNSKLLANHCYHLYHLTAFNILVCLDQVELICFPMGHYLVSGQKWFAKKWLMVCCSGL